ncbi:uncharacterized protein LOC118337072 isoform X1 [Morone saxatilis]|uniref:uncharacterized protein LOC118337072 isoform X1 n=1 Tax=Morone saxatilis TaxID=34816 RepID=UPI0015E1D005|nr:uncharacterized protein LOC118337072 isoform X1 [Morone saxatilis]
MDVRKKLAIQVVCALMCSEKTRKKKKRLWRREWSGSGRRGQQGLSVLQRELEMHDRTGFREMLRMTAEEFDVLLGMVGPLITKQHTKMRRAISPRERLSLTMRFLATGVTFRSLSFQYRIGASTISLIVMETCAALYQVMKKDFLKTPSTEAEWRTIAQDFELKWQFPHCLGALDGRRIYIQPPAKSGSLHHSYKAGFSVIMMAAVDANYKFIYTCVDTQGRVSDAGLFAQSDLRKAMDRDLLNFPPPDSLPNSDITMPYMFVGNEEFPLRPDLMKPYPCRQMDQSQRVLNYRLSRAWRVVENAFGILANRLRVFRSTICLEPEKVVKITMASLCIHNFLCERRSEAYTPPAFADWENADHSITEGTWRSQGMGSFQPVEHREEHNPSETAKMQQNLLCNYLVSAAGCVPWQEEHI